jgi:hypothetical protein
MSAPFTLYLIWLLMTVLGLCIVVLGGAEKGTRYPRRSARHPKRIESRR